MLQDGVRACAVAAQQLHVNVLPELDQGDRAALPTHVRVACAAERLLRLWGCAGATHARASGRRLSGV
jgi:hypothetical protein